MKEKEEIYHHTTKKTEKNVHVIYHPKGDIEYWNRNYTIKVVEVIWRDNRYPTTFFVDIFKRNDKWGEVRAFMKEKLKEIHEKNLGLDYDAYLSRWCFTIAIDYNPNPQFAHEFIQQLRERDIITKGEASFILGVLKKDFDSIEPDEEKIVHLPTRSYGEKVSKKDALDMISRYIPREYAEKFFQKLLPDEVYVSEGNNFLGIRDAKTSRILLARHLHELLVNPNKHISFLIVITQESSGLYLYVFKNGNGIRVMLENEYYRFEEMAETIEKELNDFLTRGW
jgi:hypothetical protein